MILVTGANGHFGNATINFLLEKGVQGNQVSALVRKEESAVEFRNRGVNAVIGDYDNYDSLLNAFKGVDKLLFVSGSDLLNRLSQHQNVINAAKEAGVKHIVYTSISAKNETETSPLWLVVKSHLQTEKWLKESGIDFTILKNNLYMDLIPAFVGEKVLETALIYLPTEDGKVGAVLRSELAEATAKVLIGVDHEGKVYDFSNTEAFSYQEVAKVISDITGKSISYVSPSAEEYAQTLSKYGVPQDFIGLFSSFAVAQAKGELDTTNDNLEKILNRKPTSIKEFLRQVYTQASPI
ncbi:SDR family oxidoreductase [Belliella sp. DSM 111904]|uniref:SDR family oxidoreductase n=1 Tax=Belliella filtrata TaxID=2923435 RepID=A0ABS9V1L4_9BACT|nr:SDR family oxidoreductase [Belliella filtrata]MCH7409868.1 SDR family oxidoreductase [Belliella filtrata]